MDFKRHLMTRIDSATKIVPIGTMIYSSGFPCTRAEYVQSTHPSKPSGTVHALVDSEGISLSYPLDLVATIDGKRLDRSHLRVVVCEPKAASPKDAKKLWYATQNNLVMCLAFLCRYWNIRDVRDFIQFADTAANVTHDASQESTTGGSGKRHKRDGTNVARSFAKKRFSAEDIHKEVQQTLVEIARIHEVVETPRAENVVGAIGNGSVVLFVGGKLYSSRSTSTEATSKADPAFGVVRSIFLRAKHPCEVVFPDGRIFWANKGSLILSPLGHISI